MTITQPINNLMDSYSVMCHSNVMGEIKNDSNIIDKIKQQQNISSPQVQLHDCEDLLVLKQGLTDVDVNSYVRPVPTAPTLEAIYGSSISQTNTWYPDWVYEKLILKKSPNAHWLTAMNYTSFKITTETQNIYTVIQGLLKF